MRSPTSLHHQCKKTFATVSALTSGRFGSALQPELKVLRTYRKPIEIEDHSRRPQLCVASGQMIKGLIIIVIGILLISRIIVDIWPLLIPGRLGAKFAEEAKRDRERNPVGYWFGRMLMMAIAAWVIVMGMMAITS